ncbi:MAG: GC-type dockerin domain-anchored protein [Phycisphaerales bacterium JB039]
MATSRVAVLGAVLAAAGGAALAQCPPQRLEPPRPWYRAEYGRAVAMNDRHLIVGDPLDASLCPIPQNCLNGAAHAYRLNPVSGVWELRQTLLPDDVGEYDAFGEGLALDGDRLIAGAAGSGGSREPGAAYVFDFDGDQWVETGRIEPVEPVVTSAFASSVAVRASLVAIGEWVYRRAWLYEETPSGWEFRQKLTGGRTFGQALALTDEWLLVGAPEDDAHAFWGGAVYAYRRGPGASVEFREKLLAPEILEGARFGDAIAVEGGVLAIGAPGWNTVHLFRLDGETWAWQEALTYDTDALLGTAVAMAGDTLVASAGYATHVYRRNAGGWRHAARLTPEPDPGPFSGFGLSAGTSGAWAVVGAEDVTVGGVESAGAAYVFDLDCLIACRVDLDGDGALTLFDFLTFFNLFAAGDLAADFDGDGELTLFDFLAFQDAFGAGC